MAARTGRRRASRRAAGCWPRRSATRPRCRRHVQDGLLAGRRGGGGGALLRAGGRPRGGGRGGAFGAFGDHGGGRARPGPRPGRGGRGGGPPGRRLEALLDGSAGGAAPPPAARVQGLALEGGRRAPRWGGRRSSAPPASARRGWWSSWPACLRAAAGGQVLLDGRDIAGRRRRRNCAPLRLVPAGRRADDRHGARQPPPRRSGGGGGAVWAALEDAALARRVRGARRGLDYPGGRGRRAPACPAGSGGGWRWRAPICPRPCLPLDQADRSWTPRPSALDHRQSQAEAGDDGAGPDPRPATGARRCALCGQVMHGWARIPRRDQRRPERIAARIPPDGGVSADARRRHPANKEDRSP